MTWQEAINELQSYADNSWGGLNEAFEMAIIAMREQNKRENQFRVPSEEEWMRIHCTPQQFAGYLNRKQENIG